MESIKSCFVHAKKIFVKVDEVFSYRPSKLVLGSDKIIWAYDEVYKKYIEYCKHDVWERRFFHPIRWGECIKTLSIITFHSSFKMNTSLHLWSQLCTSWKRTDYFYESGGLVADPFSNAGSKDGIEKGKEIWMMCKVGSTSWMQCSLTMWTKWKVCRFLAKYMST